MRAAIKDAGMRGDRYRTKYPDFNTFSQEEIDSYLGLILANYINVMPQITFWFFRTHGSIVCGKNNISKFFPRGRHRWDGFKTFFCMYDPRKDPKSIAAKNSLFKVCRMLQHLQIKVALYWDPARYLSID